VVAFQDPEHHDYDVRQGFCVVPSLEVANWLVANRGCRFAGVVINRLGNAERNVVTRTMGLGDMLMMTPILRALRRDHPKAFITLATFDIFFDIFLHNPNVDRVVQSGRFQPDGDKGGFILEDDGTRTPQDYWVECNGVAENSPELGKKHRVDIFADMAGYGGWALPDRRMDYFVTEEENEWAKKYLLDLGIQPGDRLMSMAVTSTAANRNMPQERFHQIADLAAQDGWKVLVFDRYPENGWEGAGILNLAGKTNLRQMAALMAQTHLYFGPDTGAWHLASALNIPNVVYMGAINWKLRVTTTTTLALVRSTLCYPCDRYDCRWSHKHACIDFDPNWIWETCRKHSNDVLHSGTDFPGPVFRMEMDKHDGRREEEFRAIQQQTAFIPGRGMLIGSTGSSSIPAFR
jgi:ADP-heptose:LPS heptosyltransferase